jgi:hypothetical protein
MTEQNADQIADWNGQTGERAGSLGGVRPGRDRSRRARDGRARARRRLRRGRVEPGSGRPRRRGGPSARRGHIRTADRPSARDCGTGYASPVPGDRPSSAELPEGAFDILFSRFTGDVLRRSDRGVRAYCAARSGRAGGSLSSAGAVRARTIGCACRWARSRASFRRPRRPIPKRPANSRFGDRGRVARILTAAGFTDIAIAPFDASIPFGEGGTRRRRSTTRWRWRSRSARCRACSLISPTTSAPAPRPRFVSPSRAAPASGR